MNYLIFAGKLIFGYPKAGILLDTNRASILRPGWVKSGKQTQFRIINQISATDQCWRLITLLTFPA